MKATRCESCKMFYDLEAYSECPYCHAPAFNAQQNTDNGINMTMPSDMFMEAEKPAKASKPKEEEKEHKHIFGKKKKKEEAVVDAVPAVEAPAPFAVENPAPAFTQPQPQFNPEPASQAPIFNQPTQQDSFKEENNLGSLAQAVSQAQTDDMKTVAYYHLSDDADTVVGWLVCVKGEYVGQSFNIISGRNNIGRALTNNIVLTKEKTVSREKHAAIIFDPQSKKFFIQPGESSGLTYLNDELILSSKPLNHKDFINMGATRFMFFQLCGENFSWDKYIG